MKTNISTRNTRMFMLSLALLALPISTYALGLPSLEVSHNGSVNLTNAQVVSVSGDTITSVVAFKNATSSAVIKTTASTTVNVGGNGKGGTSVSSVSAIKVGDIINISGIFTGFTSALTITADKIHTITARVIVHEKLGKIESVNTANNSFTVRTKENKILTVMTNASTTFYLPNKATSTLLTAVTLNGNVGVQGVLSADGTVMTASVVTVSNVAQKSNEHKNNEHKNDDDKSKKWHNRFFGHWNSGVHKK